jgi:S1 RNA binding domain/Zc3h12a-like Ribonuclease NYN domain
VTAYKVVVDGSNVATEGRTRPSLAQLDEAVRSFIEDYPNADVLVIVDSSFPNRIDPADVAVFEEAFLAGEIITPPAGTVGRGDAFILKVADKLGATVFSNDSFQEFHGTYEWLFEKGRLIGGKPIPGLGWVFTPRVPVRGQKSREAVREAKRQTVRVGSPEAMRPMPVPKAPPPFLTKGRDDQSEQSGGEGDRGRRKKRRGRGDRNDGRASSGVVMFDESSVDRVSLDDENRTESEGRRRGKRRGRGRGEGGGETSARAVNEPGTFLTFIASHLPGSEVEGVVDDYSSHGFYVTAGGARCYVPLSGLADPMPRSAKEVVRRGETRNFLVKAFDAVRRGVELALVGTPAAGVPSVVAPVDVPLVPAKKTTAKKAAAKKSVAKSDDTEAIATKAVTKKAAPVKKAAKKAAAEVAVPKKAAATKAAAKKAAPEKPVVPAKAPAKKAAGKKAAAPAKAEPAKKAVAKTPAVKKAAAPAKVTTAKAAPVKAAPVKKTAAKKALAKKAAAKKS